MQVIQSSRSQLGERVSLEGSCRTVLAGVSLPHLQLQDQRQGQPQPQSQKCPTHTSNTNTNINIESNPNPKGVGQECPTHTCNCKINGKGNPKVKSVGQECWPTQATPRSAARSHTSYLTSLLIALPRATPSLLVFSPMPCERDFGGGIPACRRSFPASAGRGRRILPARLGRWSARAY